MIDSERKERLKSVIVASLSGCEEVAQDKLEELAERIQEGVYEAGYELTAQKNLLRKAWKDAYAAFKGAFDTPIQRRRDSGEYAVDARRRMREIDEIFERSG